MKRMGKDETSPIVLTTRPLHSSCSFSLFFDLYPKARTIVSLLFLQLYSLFPQLQRFFISFNSSKKAFNNRLFQPQQGIIVKSNAANKCKE